MLEQLLIEKNYPRAVFPDFERAKTLCEDLNRVGICSWKKRIRGNRWEVKAACPLHVFAEIAIKHNPMFWGLLETLKSRV